MLNLVTVIFRYLYFCNMTQIMERHPVTYEQDI